MVEGIAKISTHTWKNSLCATDATVAVATAVFSVMVVQSVTPFQKGGGAGAVKTEAEDEHGVTAMDSMGNIV